MNSDRLVLTALVSRWQRTDAAFHVQHWVQQDPKAAAAWVEQFPDGPLRDAAVEKLLKLWADQDLIGAGSWLGGLVSGPSRDAAIGAYVGKIAPTLPELAAQWTESIVDDALRFQTMEALGEAWMDQDGDAAAVWIAQTSLPATTKSRLLGSASP